MLAAPDVFQALADPTRWEIVGHLASGPRCVCELMAEVPVPQSTLSTHLQVLRASGVLTGERRGRWMYYGIAREARPFLRAAWRHFPVQAGPAAAHRAAAPQSCAGSHSCSTSPSPAI